MRFTRTISIAVSALAFLPRFAQAESFPFETDSPIPDPTGITDFLDTRTITTSITEIADLNVRLVIADYPLADNSNYFITLAHEGGYAVLLNRVGKRASDSFGYADNGFDITLDDQAPLGDIHVYRLTLSGSHDNPLPEHTPLTGAWVADGRSDDSPAVLDTSPRAITPLSVFNGLNPNGEWTLLINDVVSGGSGKLVSWSLDITPVPEPAETSIAMGLTAFAGALLIRRFRK